MNPSVQPISARLLALAFVALALLAMPFRSVAQSKEQQVEELFQLMRMEQTFAQLMDTVLRQTKSTVMQQALGRQVPPEIQPEIDQLQDELAVILEQHMGWKATKADYVRIYAEAFSAEELAAIIAFYRTPAGQALITQQPLLMNRSSELVQQKMAVAGPAVQAKVAEWTKKMQQRMAPRP